MDILLLLSPLNLSPSFSNARNSPARYFDTKSLYTTPGAFLSTFRLHIHTMRGFYKKLLSSWRILNFEISKVSVAISPSSLSRAGVTEIKSPTYTKQHPSRLRRNWMGNRRGEKKGYKDCLYLGGEEKHG